MQKRNLIDCEQLLSGKYIEAATKSVLQKKLGFFAKFKLTLLKETPAQMFSDEFCEIFKNSFFYRTPAMTASQESTEERYLICF